MSRFLTRFLLLLFISVITIVIYLSYFGIKTDKFDDLIKGKANEVSRYAKLEFNKTKIHLNLKELNLAVKLQNPKILVKENQIILSKIDLFLPLKSFITSDFLLQKAEIAFFKNNIKDLTKITSVFVPRLINKQIKKIFSKGEIEGEFIIPFETDGRIGKNYGFSGKIIDATINLKKDLIIKNLSTEINKYDEQSYEILIKKGSIFDLDLSESKINLVRKNKETEIESTLKTKGNFTSEKIKEILNLLNLNINGIKNINGNADLETTINFRMNKNFKIKNLSYSSSGLADNLSLETNELKILKKYLPLYSSKMRLMNIKYEFKPIHSNSTQKLMISGGVCYNKNTCHTFKLEHLYHKKKKRNKIKGSVSLTSDELLIPRLNYKKEKDKEAILTFNVNFVVGEYYRIVEIIYKDLIRPPIEASSIGIQTYGLSIHEVKLNKNFEIVSLNKTNDYNVSVKTYSDSEGKVPNNDFYIANTGKTLISGKLFDAEPLLKSLYKSDDKKTFSKDYNSELKINFDKAITGTNDDVSNFSMIASIKKGVYNKLSLKGNFSENEIIEMSIYQIDQNKKTLQVISDRARPFIKNFDFIKGFEDGKLEYESTITKEGANSNLLITDFKVSKVPALAKLLTLASLQGIADTLSGEGIRFESFEMKSNLKGNVMNVEDALAMGPAVSILLNGYVEKGKVVSLRGTLVPATKLNAIIASIPLVGDILVGKKTGEGVVGVSFKMKGPPKDIKTTVNPIKTLTPRFITRTLEKIKKNN